MPSSAASGSEREGKAPSDMLDPTRTQRERNLETLGDREQFAQHRAHVMRLILECQTSAEDRLCVLGAGNCNDLELDVLGEHFSEVHLVDIDDQSLRTAAPRAEDVTLHNTDLTGWYDTIASDTNRDAAVESIQSATKSYQPEIPSSPFDVVISTCLLSQIIESSIAVLGRDHPLLNDSIFAIRHHHLRTMLQLAHPGGRLVLVTDFVSTVTLPELASVSDDRLIETVQSALENGNFFTGLNPAAIAKRLTTDEGLAALATDVRISDPWRWSMGPRTFAVAAITFSAL